MLIENASRFVRDTPLTPETLPAAFITLGRCSLSARWRENAMYNEIKKRIDELLVGPLFETFRAVDRATLEYDDWHVLGWSLFGRRSELGIWPVHRRPSISSRGLGSHLEPFQLNIIV